MLNTLRAIEAAARGSGSFVPDGTEHAAIAAAAERLRRAGLPLAGAFRAGAGQVARGDRLKAEGRRYVQLFRARHALGGAAAVLVRIGAQRLVGDSAAFAVWRWADAAAISLGVALGLLTPVAVRRGVTAPWTEDAELVAAHAK